MPGLGKKGPGNPKKINKKGDKEDGETQETQSPPKNLPKENDDRIVAFVTDDFKIRKMVSARKDLPLQKYTSLGAILELPKMKGKFKQSTPVYRSKDTAVPTKQILGPLPPGKPDQEPQVYGPKEDRSKTELGPLSMSTADQGRLSADAVSWNQPVPPPDGIIWPTAWAPRPPYTTPGYNRIGLKQPVGVVQVDRVPVAPSKGIIQEKEFDLPTWVSPLYRPYGIGGPYGPFGPFYEPPSIRKVKETHATITYDMGTTKKNNFIKNFFCGKEEKIAHSDQNTGNFLNSVDRNLSGMKDLLRDKRKINDKVSGVIDGLTFALEEARQFSKNLNEAEDFLADTQVPLNKDSAATVDTEKDSVTAIKDQLQVQDSLALVPDSPSNPQVPVLPAQASGRPDVQQEQGMVPAPQPPPPPPAAQPAPASLPPPTPPSTEESNTTMPPN